MSAAKYEIHSTPRVVNGGGFVAKQSFLRTDLTSRVPPTINWFWLRRRQVFAVVLVLTMGLLGACRTASDTERLDLNTALGGSNRLLDILQRGSSFASMSGACGIHLIEENCDQWIDGIDINCDGRVDFPIVFPLRLGQTVGPFPLAEFLPDHHVDEGLLLVPEHRACSRDQLKSRRVTYIGFKRIRSVERSRFEPVFNLPGGPGAAPLTPSGLRTVLSMGLVQRLIATRDVVFIDQRGMGSNLFSQQINFPALSCAAEEGPLSFNEPLQATALIDKFTRLGQTCASQLSQQGFHIAGYTLPEMSEDVNDLRRALRYPRVSLLAGSFGTQHALSVIQRHGNHIERAVLNAVEGLTQTVKLPAEVQETLVLINEKIAAQPTISEAVTLGGQYPDFLGLLTALFEKLEAKPTTVTVVDPTTGHPQFDITLGRDDAAAVISEGLGSTAFIRQLPLIIIGVFLEDPVAMQKFAAAAAPLRTKHRLIPVNYSVDCQTSASESRFDQVETQSRQALLGNWINLPKFGEGVCRPWSMPHDRVSQEEPTSPVPVLFVSGTLDARTPPSNATSLLPNFPNGHRLEIDGVSHDFAMDSASSVQYQAIVQDFFDGVPIQIEFIQSAFEFQR